MLTGDRRSIPGFLAMVLGLWVASTGRAAAAPGVDAASDFFGLTRVHLVELEVAPDQWDAMETRRQDNGVGPNGPGRPGRGGMDFNTAFEEGRAARPGLAAAMGLEFPYVHASVTLDGQRVPDVGLRYKGNGTYMMSQGIDKRPLKIDFNRFEKSRRFLGLTTLNLHNCVVDRTFLHEALGYEVSRELGVPGSRTAYARVFITIPGRHARQLLGTYVLVEQVDERFLQRWFPGATGVLVKPGTHEGLQYRGDTWTQYLRRLNVQTPGTPTDHQRLMGFLQLLEQADDAEFARRVGEFVDLDNFARFLALNVGLANLDSVLTLGQNYYAYQDPGTGKLHWWLWDLDNGWGYFALMGSPESRSNLSIHQPWQGDNRLIRRMLGVEEVRQRYRAQLKALAEGPMSPARLRPKVDAIAAALRPLLAEEGGGLDRGFQEAVFGSAGNAAAAAAPGPFGGMNLSFLAFVEGRVRSLAEQLAGRSEGSRIEFGGPGGAREPGRAGGGGDQMAMGPRRPGGPGGERGGPRQGGMNRFASMPFLMAGDRDGNGELSAEEFRSIGPRWWSDWDEGRSGRIDSQALVRGINRSFRMGGPPAGRAPSGGDPVQRLRTNTPAGGGGMGLFEGPGAFIAPPIFKAGDTNGDGSLTEAETLGLFETWQRDWDANADKVLTADEISGGFGKLVPPPPGFPGGPGGPGAAGAPIRVPLQAPPR